MGRRSGSSASDREGSAEDEVLAALLGEYPPERESHPYKVPQTEPGKRIAGASPAEAAAYVRAAIARIAPLDARVRERRTQIDAYAVAHDANF